MSFFVSCRRRWGEGGLLELEYLVDEVLEVFLVAFDEGFFVLLAGLVVGVLDETLVEVLRDVDHLEHVRVVDAGGVCVRVGENFGEYSGLDVLDLFGAIFVAELFVNSAE